jgi:2-oxoisovalerate dehydrogenase E2 component (dihydrolipoyl transacylase)
MPTFRLPDLGEGLTEAVVLRWLVAPGDTVAQDQPLVEVETAKAAVEVPSPYAGTVTALHCEEGAELAVGAPLVTVDGGSDGPAALAEREPVLVGYGARPTVAPRRRRRHGSPPAPPPVPSAPLQATPDPAGPAADPPPRPRAKPLVRRLARDLHVDLGDVGGTGPDGTITADDVLTQATGARPGASGPAEHRVPPDRPGDVRVPLTPLQSAMATAMVRSVTETPQATLFRAVDVTASMALLDRLRTMPEFADVRLSPLLLTARALLLGLRRHPRAHSSWAGDAVVEHGPINLGIAAATPRGLVVPHVADAGALSLPALARALEDLVARARAGRTSPAEMQHGTATLTNVGVFGVDAGTPILPPGQSVILALGAVRPSPWVVDGALAVREVCQLALTIDHRVVDGELGARLLADVAQVLEAPDTVLAWS